MSGLHIMILTPFIMAFIVPFLYKHFVDRIHTGWFVLIVPFLMFLYLITLVPEIAQGAVINQTLAWLPSLGINFVFYLDGLSLIFSLIITGIGALVVLYSKYYLAAEREALGNFYVYLLLFMGSMLGLVLSDNIFVLYLFWELTSISSFLLIAYWFERENSRYGALKSLLITVFGGLSMLAGFILLSLITDTYSIREMFTYVDLVAAHPWFIPTMVLILIGAFAKSVQFPFSIWLPDAMEAPTPVSAYLHSATMVKAGIYLVARLTPLFGGTAEWFWIISITGLVTMLYGAVNAVRQVDLKALLAYSTISQLGLIMSLLGIGSAAIYYGPGNEAGIYALASFVAIFHLVNHSTFKGCLFMVVGIIDLVTGTRDVRRLGGLFQLMPISFTLMLVGTFAMAGIPPFSGFLSKEMFFTATLNVTQMSIFNLESLGVLFPCIAWLASIFTFIYCMILLFQTFAGKYNPERLEKKAREAPKGMLIAPIVLALLIIGIFFFPNLLADYLLKPAWASIFPTLAQTNNLNVVINHWHGFNLELLMTISIFIFGIFLYVNLSKWRKIYNYYPQSLTLNNIYDQGILKTEAISRKITNRYMTDYIRDYLVYIFCFVIIVVGGSLWLSGGISFNSSHNASINFYEFALVIAMVAAAFAVLFSKSRLSSIIATSAIGFLVAAFFALFRAPDLALTQLVVETVTTVLFLLCFYHLPKLRKEFTRIRFKAVNACIAMGMGLIVTLTALSANGTRLFTSISSYFENSFELAGAKNIVNAILVDFRGFDTMLEILVLFIAGLGVFVLIKLRLPKGEEHEEIK